MRDNVVAEPRPNCPRQDEFTTGGTRGSRCRRLQRIVILPRHVSFSHVRSNCFGLFGTLDTYVLSPPIHPASQGLGIGQSKRVHPSNLEIALIELARKYGPLSLLGTSRRPTHRIELSVKLCPFAPCVRRRQIHWSPYSRL